MIIPFPSQDSEPLAGLITHVLEHGQKVPDRTGTGTYEIFGPQLYYDLKNHVFPLCTLKHVSFNNVLAETLWLISGEDRIDRLHEMKAKHWDPWLPKDECFGPNSLGRVYGVQWRNWLSLPAGNELGLKATDQLMHLVDGLRKDPHGRRHLVTCWNPGELDQMALPPCHVMFQCHVGVDQDTRERRLSLQVYQRSVDLFIGAPYDVGIYSLILRMLCTILGFAPGQLIFTFGSAHVYLNHVDQSLEMVNREFRIYPLLKVRYRAQEYLEDFTADDFELIGYNPHPAIKAPVAV